MTRGFRSSGIPLKSAEAEGKAGVAAANKVANTGTVASSNGTTGTTGGSGMPGYTDL